MSVNSKLKFSEYKSKMLNSAFFSGILNPLGDLFEVIFNLLSI